MYTVNLPNLSFNDAMKIKKKVKTSNDLDIKLSTYKFTRLNNISRF